MRKIPLAAMVVGLLAAFPLLAAEEPAASPDWDFNGTVIEACSCPVFCQCFFNTQPAAHHGHGEEEAEHFCRFNIAYQVNEGEHGDTDLSGAKFWVTGDLGHDFSNFDAEWAVVTFDPAVAPPQREALAEILGRIYPLKWKSFEIGADAAVVWQHDENGAHATLGGGEIAEIVLKPSQGVDGKPAVVENVRYLGAPRNDGLVIMPNEVEAYKIGDKAFAFHGTTGFMTTVDIASADFE